MPSIATEEDLEKLLRKLTTTEKVLVGLLAVNGQASVVEKKLAQLEELIADIPSQRDDLANNWNEKVVKLWSRFAGGGGEDDVQFLEPSSTAVNASAPTNKPENPIPVAASQQNFENSDPSRSHSSSFSQNHRQRSSPSPNRRVMRTTYSNQQRFRYQPPRFQNGHAQRKDFSRNIDNNTDTKSFVDSTYGTVGDSPNSLAASAQTKPIDFPSGSTFVFDDKTNQLMSDGGDWTRKPQHTSHVNEFSHNSSTKASNNIFPQKNPINTTSKPFTNNNAVVRSSNVYSKSISSAAPSINGKISVEITDGGIDWGEVSPVPNQNEPLTTTIDEATIPIPSLKNGDINEKVEVPVSNGCSGATSPPLSEPANFGQKPLEEQRPSSSSTMTTQKYVTVPPSSSHCSTYLNNRYQNKPFVSTRTAAPAYKGKPEVEISDAGIDWGSVSPPLKEVTPEKSDLKTLTETNKTTNDCSIAPQDNFMSLSSGDSFTFTSDGLLRSNNPPPPKGNYNNRWNSTANTFVPRITPICESPDPMVQSSYQHRGKNKIEVEITDAGIDWGSASPEPSTDNNKPSRKQQEASAAPLKSFEPDRFGPKVVTASSFDNNRQSFSSNQVSSSNNSFKNEIDQNFDWSSEPIIPKDSSIKIDAPEKPLLSSSISTENNSFQPKCMTATSSVNNSTKSSFNNSTSCSTSKPVAAAYNAQVKISDADFDWSAGPTSPEPTIIEPMQLDVNAFQNQTKETSKFASVDNSDDNYPQEEWAQDFPSVLIKQRLSNNYRKSLNPPAKIEVTITDAGIDWGADLESPSPKSNEEPSNSNLNHQNKLQSASAAIVEPNVSPSVNDNAAQSSYISNSYKTRTEVEVPNDFDWGSAPSTPQTSVSKVPEKLPASVQSLAAQQPLNSKVDNYTQEKSHLLSSSKSTQMDRSQPNVAMNKFSSNNVASCASNSSYSYSSKPARHDVPISNDFDWGSEPTPLETSASKVPENLVASSSSTSKPAELNRWDSKPSTDTNLYNNKHFYPLPQSNFVKPKPTSTYNYKVEIEITDGGIDWGETSTSPPLKAINIPELEKKLIAYESRILEMLPFCQKSLGIFIIETNINAMVELIGFIPREDKELTTKWCEKFAELMDSYTAVLKLKQENDDNNQRPEIKLSKSSSMANRDDIGQIEERLDAFASDLLRMMDMRPLHPKLKSKLSAFEREINTIPPECDDILNKWSNKFIYYLKKYNHVQSTDYGDDCESQFGSVTSAINERLPPERPGSSASVCNDSIMDLLRQDLDNLEMNIVSLLSLNPKEAIFHNKIAELEELIQIIPPEHEKDIEIWNNKVAKYRERFNGDGLSLSSHNSTSQLPTVGSPTLPEIGNIDQLLKDLASLESTIEKMLSARPLANDILERNLSLLAESITTIPHERTDLVDIWSAKVVNLMQAFVDTPTNVSVLSPTDDQSHLVSPTSTNFDIRSERHRPPGGPKVEYTKDQVRGKFCEVFRRLEPVRHGADYDRLKILLVMLAKARKISQPFLPDQLLYIDLFGYAWTKLSSEICEKFNTDCEDGVQKKTLSSLIFFLIDYIKQKQDMTHPQRQGNSSVSCAFCKVTGHMIQDCVAIKNNLCFTCFNYGHMQKRCSLSNPVSSEDFLSLFNSFY